MSAWLKYLLLGLLSLLAIINIYFYFFQEQFLFLDTKLEQDHVFSLDSPFREVFLENDDGSVVHGLHLRSGQLKGLILYQHGNAGDIERWSNVVHPLAELGYDVVVWDYRGYGKSTGKRSAQALGDDAQLFYDYAKEYYPEQLITLYGRSIGSGITMKLATDNNPKQVILESPFNNLGQIVQSKFPIIIPSLLRYKMPSNEYAAELNSPIYIFHGTDDKVIPFTSGEKLYNSIGQEDKQFYTIEGGGHNDLDQFPEYWDGIYSILGKKNPVSAESRRDK